MAYRRHRCRRRRAHWVRLERPVQLLRHLPRERGGGRVDGTGPSHRRLRRRGARLSRDRTARRPGCVRPAVAVDPGRLHRRSARAHRDQRLLAARGGECTARLRHPQSLSGGRHLPARLPARPTPRECVRGVQRDDDAHPGGRQRCGRRAERRWHPVRHRLSRVRDRPHRCPRRARRAPPGRTPAERRPAGARPRRGRLTGER